MLSQHRYPSRVLMVCAATICAFSLTACAGHRSQTADANVHETATRLVAESPTLEKTATPSEPKLFVKPIAENVFSISLRDGAVLGHGTAQQHFLLRNAGYVIAHNLCGKMSKTVSSIAFQNHGTDQAASVTATIVCKAPKGVEQQV